MVSLLQPCLARFHIVGGVLDSNLFQFMATTAVGQQDGIGRQFKLLRTGSFNGKPQNR